MARFNVKTYNPAHDSTNLNNEGTGTVLLDLTETDGVRVCECGCGLEPQGTKSKLRMGHDARLKGILLRAHLAGVEVTTIHAENRTTSTALRLAKVYDNGTHSWTEQLKRAAIKQAEVSTAAPRKRSPKAAPKGPQVGDLQTVKVGRWEYTGTVVSIDSDGVVVEYATSKGERKQTTVAIPA